MGKTVFMLAYGSEVVLLVELAYCLASYQEDLNNPAL